MELHTPWHKNYCAKNVFLNASSFPLCSDMNSLWKRNCVSNGSSVIWEILLSSSAINSDDSGFQGPPVSTEIGTK